jgi:hypothetical protein
MQAHAKSSPSKAHHDLAVRTSAATAVFPEPKTASRLASSKNNASGFVRRPSARPLSSDRPPYQIEPGRVVCAIPDANPESEADATEAGCAEIRPQRDVGFEINGLPGQTLRRSLWPSRPKLAFSRPLPTRCPTSCASVGRERCRCGSGSADCAVACCPYCSHQCVGRAGSSVRYPRQA